MRKPGKHSMKQVEVGASVSDQEVTIKLRNFMLKSWQTMVKIWEKKYFKDEKLS